MGCVYGIKWPVTKSQGTVAIFCPELVKISVGSGRLHYFHSQPFRAGCRLGDHEVKQVLEK